jgi:transketolase
MKLRDHFINELCARTRPDKDIDARIRLIVADVGYNVIEPFSERHPDKFFNVGIAEQTAVNMAAGMASTGARPFIYGIIPFMIYRAMDQIRMFMHIDKLPICLVGVGVGDYYKSAGPSHWGIQDEVVMRAFDNITTVTVSTEAGLLAAINDYLTGDRPYYIRLDQPKGRE